MECQRFCCGLTWCSVYFLHTDWLLRRIGSHNNIYLQIHPFLPGFGRKWWTLMVHSGWDPTGGRRPQQHDSVWNHKCIISLFFRRAVGSKTHQQPTLYLDKMLSGAKTFSGVFFRNAFKCIISWRTMPAWSLWIMEDQKWAIDRFQRQKSVLLQ